MTIHRTHHRETEACLAHMTLCIDTQVENCLT